MTSTAILFFSRSAVQEARQKGLDLRFGVDRARRLTEVMIDSSLRAAMESGLDVHEFTGSRQVGASLGQRLANAFAELYALGYDRVISIGNDSPGLTAADLLAAAQLSEPSIGLGPSRDGGVYLISISRELFDKERFIQLPWETSGIREALHHMYSASAIVTGRTLTDIDSWQDIATATAETDEHSYFFACVSALMWPIVTGSAHLTQGLPITLLKADLPKRAPPVAFA